MMVGIIVSFLDGLFSGAMLNFQGENPKGCWFKLVNMVNWQFWSIYTTFILTPSTWGAERRWQHIDDSRMTSLDSSLSIVSGMQWKHWTAKSLFSRMFFHQQYHFKTSISSIFDSAFWYSTAILDTKPLAQHGCFQDFTFSPAKRGSA